MSQDNWHTLWSGDNGVSIQKSKTLLRGCNYRVRTLYAREPGASQSEVCELWGDCPVPTWGSACNVVASKGNAGTPPPTEPEMPREDEPAERPTVYR